MHHSVDRLLNSIKRRRRGAGIAELRHDPFLERSGRVWKLHLVYHELAGSTIIASDGVIDASVVGCQRTTSAKAKVLLAWHLERHLRITLKRCCKQSVLNSSL
ncbi:unnamed protein product, partial [Iphiclides podalirius]